MNFLKTLLNICLLKAKPQDLPASQQILVLSFIAAVVTQLLSSRPESKPAQDLLLSSLQYGLYALIIWMLLNYKNKSARYVQSMTALFGTSALIQIIASPILRKIDPADITSLSQNSKLLLMLILIWGFVITVTILKETLESTVGQAIFLAVASQLTIVAISSLLVSSIGI